MALEKVNGLIEVVVDVRQLKKKEKENSYILPYFLCPAFWTTTNGTFCCLDLEPCEKDIQNCPKLQKYILKL